MFSPLVAPFSENEILEEQLAGGKAVWLLILKWRNARFDQTKSTTDLRNSYIKQSSVSRVFFVTLRVKNMGKYPNKIKPCYSKHILLDPQPLLYLEWGSVVDSYITICIKKCHRHGSCNNDWEKVYKMFKFLHLQYVYVTGKLNSD